MPKKPTKQDDFEDIEFTIDDCVDSLEEALEELGHLRRFIKKLRLRVERLEDKTTPKASRRGRARA